ncbi:helix-turn-helix domain-containing protein [Embleya sp. NPDC059237]|uniref:helix-turn-helix domain-containing protein n=1 Tax=Embleya sp. NPDC059237 TaxID=3346784 RepID=UPI00367EA6E7
MLDVLGLDDAAESVYRAMLTRPGHGVTALAAELGMSDTQVRSALDRLSELALLRPSAEHDGHLHAVSPEVGMEVLLARQQAELVAQQQRIEASRAAAARLIAECADLRPAAGAPGVEQLIGLDAIRDRLTGLTREVTSEVMTFAPGGAQTADNMEAAKPLDAELLKRGVRMRTLYLDSVRNNPPSIAYADWLAERGGQVRTTPALPVRMIIVDRTTAVVPIDTRDTAHGAVVLTGLGTLAALCALFDTVWESAAPLGEARTRDVRGLTGQEAEALRLLAQGLTDEAIANRLGVSARTARRIAAELMEALGARSRFQAGVAAVHKGWI